MSMLKKIRRKVKHSLEKVEQVFDDFGDDDKESKAKVDEREFKSKAEEAIKADIKMISGCKE